MRRVVVAPAGGARVDAAQRAVAAHEEREHGDDAAAGDRRRAGATVSASPVATCGSSRPLAPGGAALPASSALLDRLGGRGRRAARGARARAAPSGHEGPRARAISEQEEEGHRQSGRFLARLCPRSPGRNRAMPAPGIHRTMPDRSRLRRTGRARGDAAPRSRGPSRARRRAGERLAARLAAHRPPASFALVLTSLGYVAARGGRDRARLPARRRPPAGPRDRAAPTRPSTTGSPRTAAARCNDALLRRARRSATSRSSPALVMLVGLVAAVAAPLAAWRVHPRRDPGRGRDLPRREPDRAPRAPDRAAARPPAGQPELSLRARRGVGRRLRRARAAAHVARPRALGARSLRGRSPCALPLVVAASRMYRGMHHPIDATPGVLIGLGVARDRALADRAPVTSPASRAAPDGTPA